MALNSHAAYNGLAARNLHTIEAVSGFVIVIDALENAGFTWRPFETCEFRRLGLTAQTDPVKVEQDLCELFSKRTWIDTGHRFVLHGRYVCQAKRPRCAHCPLYEICPSVDSEAGVLGRWTQRADRQQQVVSSRGQITFNGLIE